MSAAQIQGQALFVAAGIELLFVTCGALMVVNYRRAARGSLDRNAYVGIRAPRPSRSRQAWEAAHRVAVGWAPAYVLFILVMGLGLWAAADKGWRLVVALVGGGGVCVLTVMMCATSYFANRAADAVDGRRAPLVLTGGAGTGADFNLSQPGPRLSPRNAAILRWVFAVAACALNAVLLGSLIDGFVLALHHQLQPGDYFGIRDDAALACWPRWYAAQIALFRWMLFGNGMVLLVGMGLYVGAAVQRRSPWDIWALVLGNVIALTPVLIAAGSHADGVANAIPCPAR